MKILLINHYAGSNLMGMEFRPYYFAREWIAAGHKVTVLGASFSHLRRRQPDVRSDLGVTEEGGVRFRWIRSNRYAGNGKARVGNMLNFIGRLSVHAGRLAREERPDVVICSSTYPLDIYPGAWIARKSRARLVFEVHDLWPLSPMLLGGYSPRHPAIRVMQHAEDWAYRHADIVVSILPHARDYMVSHGLSPEKFVHVPNGIALGHSDEQPAALPPELEDRVRQEHLRGRFLIGYAGGFNLGMAVDLLLDAACLLASDKVSFLLAGDGPTAPAIRERLAKAGIDNFHLLGHIPKPLVPGFLARMDALAVPWRRNPLFRFGVSPNKVFDYMLAGKPVLQASDASNDIVSEACCGFTAAPDDPAAFAAAARQLLSLSAADRRRLGENGRRFVIEHHDCRTLARNFLVAVMQAPCNAQRLSARAARRIERDSLVENEVPIK